MTVKSPSELKALKKIIRDEVQKEVKSSLSHLKKVTEASLIKKLKIK